MFNLWTTWQIVFYERIRVPELFKSLGTRMSLQKIAFYWIFWLYPKKKKARKSLILRAFTVFWIIFCGERGIRTPGTSQYNGFQDRRDRPLCHLSIGMLYFLKRCKDTAFFEITKYKFRLLQTLFSSKMQRHL